MTGQIDIRGGRLDGVLRLLVWGGAAALWLLPLAAMQFTAEVDWTAFDFAIWGAMLLAAAGICELALRVTDNLAYRAGVVVAAGAAFLLVWVNLAVGIIGAEEETANLLFFGVIAIAIVGGVLVRFRPAGMAGVMLVAAAVQAAIGAVALASGWGAGAENWPAVIIVTTGVFGAAWLLSAWLFRLAAKTPARG